MIRDEERRPGVGTEAADEDQAKSLDIKVPEKGDTGTAADMRLRGLTVSQAAGLAHANHLVENGVPVFIASPDMSSGEWNPTGGHGGTGYWLPARWQQTVPDVSVVDRWRPGYALCAVMGHVVDLLDADPRAGGDASRIGLMDAGLWPISYGTQSTPSGGTHDFPRTLEVRSLDNYLPGLDVKAGTHDGNGRGFGFIAPTVRMSKTTGSLEEYLWKVPPHLHEIDLNDDSGVEIAEMIVRAHSRSVNSAAVVGRFELPAVIPVHQRDSIFFRYACALRARDTDLPAALAAMKTAWRTCEQPANDVYPLDEALTKVRRAFDLYPAGRWKDDHAAVPPDPFDAQTPVPLFMTAKLPDFPIGRLPSSLRAMVEALAKTTQTDIGMPATSVLTVLAATVGGKVEIEVRSGWHEPLNLYTVTVAAPGERKSAVQAASAAPLRSAEARLAVAGAAHRLEQDTRKQIAVKAADKAQAAAGNATADKRANLIAEAIAAAHLADTIDVPCPVRLLADDTTPEALASLLAEQGGRIAVISAEGGIFDTLAGRYSNTPNFDALLKGHCGDAMRVDRKGRPPESVDHPAITMGLMIQPQVLSSIGANSGFRGRGLLARFLYCVPDSKLGRRAVGMPGVPVAIATAYDAFIGSLVTAFAGETGTVSLGFDDDAMLAVVELEAEIEPQLAGAGELAALADWGGKYVGAVCRLAGLLHLAQHGVDGAQYPVTTDTLAAAAAIGTYYKQHAIAAFISMHVDQTAADAAYLLELIIRKGNDEVSRRDLHSWSYRGRFAKAPDLDAPIAMLVDFGWLAPKPTAITTASGRKPGPRWTVHPSALSAQSTQSQTQSSRSEMCG